MSDASQTSGKLHSAKGDFVETVGNAVGSESMAKDGRQEHVEGETEKTTAKIGDYISNATDYVSGAVKNMTGAATNDKSEQAEGAVKRDVADKKMDINNPTS